MFFVGQTENRINDNSSNAEWSQPSSETTLNNNNKNEDSFRISRHFDQQNVPEILIGWFVFSASEYTTDMRTAKRREKKRIIEETKWAIFLDTR